MSFHVLEREDTPHPSGVSGLASSHRGKRWACHVQPPAPPHPAEAETCPSVLCGPLSFTPLSASALSACNGATAPREGLCTLGYGESVPGSREEPPEAALQDADEDKAHEAEGCLGTSTTQNTGLSAEPG